jgi:hypothetical protein
VGALGHYLEAEGVPTTSISLVREHTEVIRPPRALWVTFELARPLGAPDDAALQPIFAASADPAIKRIGTLLLVPATQMHRLAGDHAAPGQ